jgi:hypothetical protein
MILDETSTPVIANQSALVAKAKSRGVAIRSLKRPTTRHCEPVTVSLVWQSVLFSWGNRIAASLRSSQ